MEQETTGGDRRCVVSTLAPSVFSGDQIFVAETPVVTGFDLHDPKTVAAGSWHACWCGHILWLRPSVCCWCGDACRNLGSDLVALLASGSPGVKISKWCNIMQYCVATVQSLRECLLISLGSCYIMMAVCWKVCCSQIVRMAYQRFVLKGYCPAPKCVCMTCPATELAWRPAQACSSHPR